MRLVSFMGRISRPPKGKYVLKTESERLLSTREILAPVEELDSEDIFLNALKTYSCEFNHSKTPVEAFVLKRLN